MNALRNFIDSLRQIINRNLAPFILVFLLFVCGSIVVFPHVFVLIPSGFYGVIYRPLSGGIDEKTVLEEGLYITFPWNRVYKYDGRVQVDHLEIDVLTADQLKSKVKVSFQYSINTTTLPLLHKFIGPDFLDKVVIPEVTSATRQMFGQQSSTQAYTTSISQLIGEIAITADTVIISKLSPRGLNDVRLIRVNAVQLEDIVYPIEMQNAIQEKLVQEQIAQSYAFRIEAARLEVDRKVIEAEGIKKFQGVVNAGLTDNYLKLKGIEATEKLASSQNAKIVVIGSGSKGLPLIFGDDAIGLSSKGSATPR